MLGYKDFLEFGRERGILFTDVQIGSKCLVSEQSDFLGRASQNRIKR